MRSDRNDVSFNQIKNLICPECGGKLLRGPRGAWLNHNLTCRDCQMRFNCVIAFYNGKPESDTEFQTQAVVLGWESMGKDPAGAAFYEPADPERRCKFCDMPFHGPSQYCCLACAIDDASGSSLNRRVESEHSGER